MFEAAEEARHIDREAGALRSELSKTVSGRSYCIGPELDLRDTGIRAGTASGSRHTAHKYADTPDWGRGGDYSIGSGGMMRRIHWGRNRSSTSQEEGTGLVVAKERMASSSIVVLFALRDTISRSIVERVDVLLHEAACPIFVGSVIRFLAR